MKPLDLTGAVVIVTGAARGIGQATAAAFTTAGATVHPADLDPTPSAAPTAPNPTSTAQARSNTHQPPAHPSLNTHPTPSNSGDGNATTAEAHAGQQQTRPTPAVRQLDVTSRDSFKQFVDDVLDQHGRIDVLVNNAGVMPLGSFLDEDDAISRATLDVNVWGLIHGMRLVLPGMLANRHGHIVNIASMAGKIPFPGMAVYNASKYAAVGLTAAVRRELHGTGVTASAVLPSAVRTSLSSGVRLGGILPTVDPEDVAAAVLRTCRTRQPELAVPRWLGGWKLLDGLVPSTVMAHARRLAGDDRGLYADPAARASYTERVSTFSTSRH
ncbi:SDR family oxidoreductase [Kribbella sandramycini]|uniref:NAD(P)-dependent dehydrogenase (Short-subunit alcohol dehydrogenase family) n=1 Tax=Kribbella sandramycini TaxID=60450 RepID=A0A841SDW4_9ACTN|nr:SDR family oxidoreductase [Kribbella sandramycini]MBB6568221.1 NAD(P)-dependent dehydrogenase (short-subunit alcohol dehydrogenase family) [Kribbella sandramycini]